MLKFLHAANLYSDITQLTSLIGSLEFDDAYFGKEIPNFYHKPPELDKFFSEVASQPIEIQPNTGFFRKPSDIVHCEPFYEHSQWICVVAMEDTILRTHRHIDGYKTLYDVMTDSSDIDISAENWIETSEINVSQNEFVMIRPGTFYSLEKDKLVQIFILNRQLDKE